MRSWALALTAAASMSAAPVEFNRDVRPILSDKCFSCHGPDAAVKRIPLRLDSEAAAKADLGGRRAVVEGKPEESVLIQRITAEKRAMRMPPVHTGLKLTDAQIGTLRDWIAQGGKWEKHWSFLPPKRTALPQLQSDWPRNPIDYFVLARLEKEGLTPAPEASREALIRRVSLDLTGLPPTPAEIDSFLRDASPRSYEKVVDRLLSTPRYGERMAARWLDAARYADTNGYQFDGEREMWRWRDWVIDAFNRNQPFNQFALDQIAGDLEPGATLDQKIATGFSRNHRANTEDGIIPEEYAVEYVVDRIETTSTVFLGLTMGCARCHNHKYDPITQKEFYRLFAYFNNVPENGRAMKYGNSPPLIPAPTREQQAALDAVNQRIAAAERFLHDRAALAATSQQDWERSLKGEQFWAPAVEVASAFPLDQADDLKPAGEVGFVPGLAGQAAQFDGTSLLMAPGAGALDIDDRFSITAWIRSDRTPNGAVVTHMSDKPEGKGYGLYAVEGKLHFHLTSNYVNDALRVETAPVLESGKWHHVAVTYAGSKMAEGVRLFVDGRPVEFTVGMETLYRPFRNAGAKFTEPLRIGGGGGPQNRFRGLIDDVRLYTRLLNEDQIAAAALGVPLNRLAAKPAAQRTTPESNALRWQFLATAAPAEVREAWTRLEALHREREQLERTFPTVMVMAERPQPRQTHFLIRGHYSTPGEAVEPGLPAVLPPLPPGAPNNRLGFARWLIDPDNPLLARVAVNRLWQMLFGMGLVKTTEDFGSQGEWPSHPELLDWMACRFIDGGWDTKALLKTVVMSATYRQDSKASAELLQRDPENRLLARGPRVRMPAEMVRDQALFAAGLLTLKVGGPSVKPYQPEGLWKDLIMQDMEYVQSKGPDLYRRSLYTFWKRTVAPPMMMNFDAANREACVVRENRTNTPLQALNLMNDVTFIEAARWIGRRMIREGGAAPESRLRFGFRLVTSRGPTPAEEELLRHSLNYHLDHFAGKVEDAQRYLRQGDTPPDPALNPGELAAYASVASLLLNLDEAITKE
ncbi:MAG: DUF1553 domain-containing protein [Bryobacteraceae bacterium]